MRSNEFKVVTTGLDAFDIHMKHRDEIDKMIRKLHQQLTVDDPVKYQATAFIEKGKTGKAIIVFCQLSGNDVICMLSEFVETMTEFHYYDIQSIKDYVNITCKELV